MNGSDYRLDAQVGFVLRRVNQRHLSIFSKNIAELTPRQFAALAKLCETGPSSQNALGRATAMDAATIKGVIDRLKRANLVETSPDPGDLRRLFVEPTTAGRETYARLEPLAKVISEETLEPLAPAERKALLSLLGRLV